MDAHTCDGLSVCLAVCLSVGLSVGLSVCLSVRPSVCLSVSVCLSCLPPPRCLPMWLAVRNMYEVSKQASKQGTHVRMFVCMCVCASCRSFVWGSRETFWQVPPSVHSPLVSCESLFPGPRRLFLASPSTFVLT